MDLMTTTALLVKDIQNGIVERFATDSESLLAAVGRATGAARAAGSRSCT